MIEQPLEPSSIAFAVAPPLARHIDGKRLRLVILVVALLTR
jgi:hypothetical protein